MAAVRRLRSVLSGCGTATSPECTPASGADDARGVSVVATTKGDVRGFVDGKGIATWRGIPFAAPPVGPHRFKRAVPAESWSGELSCTEFGAVSWQATPEPGQLCDEDCLYLNVQTAAGSTNAPVFVWVHGGGFTGGAGSNAGYDGAAALAQDGLCVVTINYRLGALGWAKLTDGDANCGLWDQITALQWVQDEIAKFGGDPGNVTVSGESAGGTSVLSLLASPIANPLFHKCVPMSFMAYQTVTLDEAATIAAGFASALGEAEASQAALAKYSAEEILALQDSTDSPYAQSTVNIAPGWMDIGGAMLGKDPPKVRTTVSPGSRMMHREGGHGGFSFMTIADGEILAATQQLCLRSGVASHIKVLFGSDRDEMAFRADRANPKASMMATYGHFTESRERFVTQVVHELRGFGDPDTTPPWGDELLALAEEVAAAYEQEYGDNWQTCMDRFCSDAAFGASTLMCAEEQAKHAPDTTWAYRWDGSKGNCEIDDAYHGWELMFLFNTPPPGLLERAPQLQPTADSFRAAFVALCKHGDPNCSEVPQWSCFGANKKELMVFGGDSDSVSVCAAGQEHSAIHVLVDKLASLMHF